MDFSMRYLEFPAVFPEKTIQIRWWDGEILKDKLPLNLIEIKIQMIAHDIWLLWPH